MGADFFGPAVYMSHRFDLRFQMQVSRQRLMR
jgi:hypothetical protein